MKDAIWGFLGIATCFEQGSACNGDSCMSTMDASPSHAEALLQVRKSMALMHNIDQGTGGSRDIHVECDVYKTMDEVESSLDPNYDVCDAGDGKRYFIEQDGKERELTEGRYRLTLQPTQEAADPSKRTIGIYKVKEYTLVYTLKDKLKQEKEQLGQIADVRDGVKRMRIFMIRTVWDDFSYPHSTQNIWDWMYKGTGSAAEVIRRSSKGKLIADTADGKIVTVHMNRIWNDFNHYMAWNERTQAWECDKFLIRDDVFAKVREQLNIDPDKYTFREVFVPEDGLVCGWSGTAMRVGTCHPSNLPFAIPSSQGCALLYRYIAKPFLRLHELGHNLGLAHSHGMYEYSSRANFDTHLIPIQSSTWDAYGDPTTAMGNIWGQVMYLATNMEHMGFISEAAGEVKSWTTGSGTGPWALMPLNGDFNTRQNGEYVGIKIDDPEGMPHDPERNGVWRNVNHKGGSWWMSFRSDSDGTSELQEPIPNEFKGKVMIHWAGWVEAVVPLIGLHTEFMGFLNSAQDCSQLALSTNTVYVCRCFTEWNSGSKHDVGYVAIDRNMQTALNACPKTTTTTEGTMLAMTYTFFGQGSAGKHEKWSIDIGMGLGVQSCFKAVLATPECNTDYFMYAARGDGNCGCKTDEEPLDPRDDKNVDHYQITYVDVGPYTFADVGSAGKDEKWGIDEGKGLGVQSCLEALVDDPDCAKDHFMYAARGDQNCGCKRPGPLVVREVSDVDHYRITYTFSGVGTAGFHERWGVDKAKGLGVHSCFEAVTADSQCAKDYFMYAERGDQNCGCKGPGPLVSRDDKTVDHYQIARAQNGPYTFVGPACAGPEKWGIDKAMGLGVQSCYQAAMADLECAKDFFSYADRGDKNCGCKKVGALKIRKDGSCNYYQIAASQVGPYTFIGDGCAGKDETWSVDTAMGLGVQSCYEAVMANPECSKDYFMYAARGDKNCGCKRPGPLSVRGDKDVDYYQIGTGSIAVSTRLTTSHSAGATILKVQNPSQFKLGQKIVLAKGTKNEEKNEIVGFGSIVLEQPLRFNQSANTAIEGVPPAADQETWGGIGSAATLDDEGYKAVLATCCNLQMEVFMHRFIDGLGLELGMSMCCGVSLWAVGFPALVHMRHWLA